MANLQRIKQIAAQKNITLGNLALQCGITPTGLSKIMRENSTTVTTLEKIANILQVSPIVFFDAAPTASQVGGGSSIQMVGNNNSVTVPKDILAMLAEKDKQLAEKDKLISRYTELLLAQK